MKREWVGSEEEGRQDTFIKCKCSGRWRVWGGGVRTSYVG